MKNLHLAFPQHQPEALKQIEKDFYRHFCDLFLESVKTLSVSEKELKKRYRVVNIELLKELEHQKSTMVLFSHYGNWEWSISVNKQLDNPGVAVYKKINNKYFDALFRNIRGRWNMALVPAEEAVKRMVKNEKDGRNTVYGLVSDQSPMVHNAQFWAPYFGITVPIYTGGVAMAHKYNMALLYGKVKKVDRGYYTLEFIPIAKDAAAQPPNELAKRFMGLAEAHIKEAPQYYLWTHNRWKHRDKVPEEFR